MKKSNRKNTIKSIMLALILITLCLFFISNTYARYASSASGDGTVEVAQWAVKINNDNIVTSDSLTITEFEEVANNNVVDGKVAPASSVYADFVINPDGSEVAIDYWFEVTDVTASSGSSVPTGLAVEKVCLVEGTTETPLTADGGKYKGTIGLKTQDAALTSSEAQTVRVYVKWTDGGSETDVTNTVNVNHTTAGTTPPTLKVTVKGTAVQHI